MRCRACNCILQPDDDAELCADCIDATGVERNAPIATEYDDLVDQINWIDRARSDDVFDDIFNEGQRGDGKEE